MHEQTAALARRYFAGVLNGDLAQIDDLIAADVRFYGPSYWGEPIVGRDGFRGFVAYLRAAFPDVAFTVHEEVVAGDRVATRFSFTATHLEEWMGIAPTGRAIELPGVDTFRIEDGRIVEIRVFYDTLGLMQQLGVASTGEPASATG
jgi:steroid delta-isomerase-like uncharacterized protein